MASGIELQELENLIKPVVMGWINSGIANAKISGLTINYVPSPVTADDTTLPNNLAYTNIQQTFIVKQKISTTTTNPIGASVAGLFVDYTGNPSSADASAFYIGVWGLGQSASGNANNVGTIVGTIGYGIQNGTGTAAPIGVLGIAKSTSTSASINLLGGSFSTDLSGAGTISNAVAVNAGSPVKSAGTIINSKGLNVANQGISGITDSYGIYVEAQSGSTNNYAIYSAGGNIVFLENKTDTSGIPVGLLTDVTYNPAGASSGQSIGSLLRAFVASGNAQNFTSSVTAMSGQTYHQGTGTVTTAQGISSVVFSTSSGTITNANGFSVNINNTSTGTVTNGIIVNVGAGANGGGGVFTNNVGIAIAARAVGTNKTNLLLGTTTAATGDWNIYSAATDPNYFAGRFVLAEISIPSAPAANQIAVYAKDNGSGVTKLYTLDSASTETELGAGTGLTHPQVMARVGLR